MEFAGYEANRDGASTSFSCRFQAVPKSIRYMPPATTPRPLIHGPQTATVVGKQGDEIHTDKFGRVKLQFHWDRVGTKNEKSSCWVRVSSPWASKQFGMIALPRVGDEVVVEFLEGNPDRPLVTGSVYNGVNMPPYELPAKATVSGIKSRSSKQGGEANFNELRFDDAKGSEYVWFQAEKDYQQLVKHDALQKIENDLTVEVTNNVTEKIGGKLDLTIVKTATLSLDEDVHLKIKGDLNGEVTGALNLKVTDAVAIKGDKAIKVTSGDAFAINVGQAFKLSAVSSVHIRGTGIVIDGGTQLTIKAGGAFVTLGPDGVSISGTMVKINSGGSAGSASSAQAASPPAPLKAAAVKANKDPLAK
jgi:type VI secretion system secreted protein VgrG